MPAYQTVDLLTKHSFEFVQGSIKQRTKKEINVFLPCCVIVHVPKVRETLSISKSSINIQANKTFFTTNEQFDACSQSIFNFYSLSEGILFKLKHTDNIHKSKQDYFNSDQMNNDKKESSSN